MRIPIRGSRRHNKDFILNKTETGNDDGEAKAPVGREAKDVIPICSYYGARLVAAEISVSAAKVYILL